MSVPMLSLLLLTAALLAGTAAQTLTLDRAVCPALSASVCRVTLQDQGSYQDQHPPRRVVMATAPRPRPADLRARHIARTRAASAPPPRPPGVAAAGM